MESYIGEKKVVGITILEGVKTPTQQEMVKVIFENGDNEIMPKLRFELINTKDISDASAVQEKIKDKVGSTLFSVLHEYGMLVGEIEGVLDRCSEHVNSGLQKAEDIMFKNVRSKIPLIDINNILLEDRKNNATTTSDDATASSGSEPDSAA